LMDTMTNVVGVLIIMMVMIGISLATTVKKVLSELPDVSVEEHAKLKEEVKKFEEKRDPAEVKQDIAKVQEDLKKLEEAMAKLEEQKAKDPVVMVDIEKLLKELEMLEKERNERRDRVAALTDEAEKLKARLDTTPRYVPPPPVQVRLPNPKTMPDQAAIHHVLVSGNKLMPVRIQELQTAVENELEELKKNNSDIIVKKEDVKGPDGKPMMKKVAGKAPAPMRKVTFEPVKLTKYFDRKLNQRPPSPRDANRDFLVEVGAAPGSAAVQMKLTMRTEAGESFEMARQPASTFRMLLKLLKQDPKSVVWFHVSKDSIPAYLAARDIVDAEGLPVTWEIDDRKGWSVTLPNDYQVPFTPPPVVAKPPTPPPPPGAPAKPAVTIAAPKAAVD
ncbi:MAG: hypothetical protein RIS92_1635, partial [Verrucomicrobiota bacterium]